MTEWGEIARSKREMRKKLAARAIAEKLALLDILRERALILRVAVSTPTAHDATEILPTTT